MKDTLEKVLDNFGAKGFYLRTNQEPDYYTIAAIKKIECKYYFCIINYDQLNNSAWKTEVIDFTDRAFVICNDCDQETLDFIRMKGHIVAYNAAIYHVFNEAADKMTAREVYRFYNPGKATKILASRIKQKVLCAHKKRMYDFVLKRETSLELLNNRVGWENEISVNRSSTYRNDHLSITDSTIEKVYIIDSAEDSHADLARDGLKSLQSSVYVVKMEQMLTAVRNTYPNAVIKICEHPRRCDRDILRILKAEIVPAEDPHKGGLFTSNRDYTVIFSGPSLLGLDLKDQGYVVKFYYLSESTIHYYYLRKAGFL